MIRPRLSILARGIVDRITSPSIIEQKRVRVEEYLERLYLGVVEFAIPAKPYREPQKLGKEPQKLPKKMQNTYPCTEFLF
ncbi:hypothetical protein HOC80_02275 [archaeon]|jgi:hypothetical protein|nr:hypothetical protein [archaeon]MBT4416906.1 hypothetical protein [archaeon]